MFEKYFQALFPKSMNARMPYCVCVFPLHDRQNKGAAYSRLATITHLKGRGPTFRNRGLSSSSRIAVVALAILFITILKNSRNKIFYFLIET